MWKKIIIGVVALGFAWSWAPTRARMSTALSPVFGMMGPVGYKMQEPMRRWRADNDLKFLVEQLQMDKTEGKQVPGNAKAFTDWMARKPGAGNRGKDPWGQLYWMKKSGDAVTVGSSGPDGAKDTPDDLRRSAVL